MRYNINYDAVKLHDFSYLSAGQGNFSSKWARYGKIKYFADRIIMYSQSELFYTVNWIQSAGQSKALHGLDLASGPYFAHPCLSVSKRHVGAYVLLQFMTQFRSMKQLATLKPDSRKKSNLPPAPTYLCITFLIIQHRYELSMLSLHFPFARAPHLHAPKF